MPKLTPLHIEYRKACARELKFLEKRSKKKEGGLTKMLADKVPAGLQSTLDKAFEKSFIASSNFSNSTYIIALK